MLNVIYAACHIQAIMLSAIMPNVVMLSVFASLIRLIKPTWILKRDEESHLSKTIYSLTRKMTTVENLINNLLF